MYLIGNLWNAFFEHLTSFSPLKERQALQGYTSEFHGISKILYPSNPPPAQSPSNSGLPLKVLRIQVYAKEYVSASRVAKRNPDFLLVSKQRPAANFEANVDREFVHVDILVVHPGNVGHNMLAANVWLDRR